MFAVAVFMPIRASPGVRRRHGRSGRGVDPSLRIKSSAGGFMLLGPVHQGFQASMVDVVEAAGNQHASSTPDGTRSSSSARTGNRRNVAAPGQREHGARNSAALKPAAWCARFENVTTNFVPPRVRCRSPRRLRDRSKRRSDQRSQKTIASPRSYFQSVKKLLGLISL